MGTCSWRDINLPLKAIEQSRFTNSSARGLAKISNKITNFSRPYLVAVAAATSAGSAILLPPPISLIFYPPTYSLCTHARTPPTALSLSLSLASFHVSFFLTLSSFPSIPVALSSSISAPRQATASARVILHRRWCILLLLLLLLLLLCAHQESVNSLLR